ncbi:hypothetical protein ANCCAN_16955 [Ancylostoma caninum]|uniref:Uncharacterized protein n=1 Tax=Ancylostoma caninum TaxID=29170 RepID=A0A368FY90_ANCCA|nr:hypothetical protein ANCCAN_16955 [Ancylostoma caninum]
MLSAVGFAAATLVCDYFIDVLFDSDRNKRLIAKEGYYVDCAARASNPALVERLFIKTTTEDQECYHRIDDS